MTIGANESTSLYLLQHIERYRRVFPKMKVQVRRSLSSKIPSQLLDGELELGVISYDPDDDHLISQVISTDRLSLVVSPQHRFADRDEVSIRSSIWKPSSRTMCCLPTVSVLREFQRHKVPLNMDVEMPTVETIRSMVQRNEGVAFLPRMCVEQEIEQDLLREIFVKELYCERKIRLVYPGPPGLEPRRQGVSGSSKERPRGDPVRSLPRARPLRRVMGTIAPRTAVIGGGIIGASIAWRLARQGAKVTLFERARFGGEASWAAAGMLSPGGEIDENSERVELFLESRRMYREFVEELSRTTGEPIDYQECGAIDLAYSSAEWEDLLRRQDTHS